MSKALFITGTGTDVGKTYVTGLILKKLQETGKRIAYYKAAMSGNERRADGSLVPGDALSVKHIAKLDQPLEEMCPYIYEHAVSPHLASRMEGNPVQLQTVLAQFDAVCDHYDYVTVEGSGGIICPLRFDEEHIQLETIIQARDLSCLIVADAGLGTINAVVLTVSYMNAHKIPVKGIIFNNFEPDNLMHLDNLIMCEKMTGKKVIACVKADDEALEISCDALASFYEEVKGELK